MVIVPKLIGIEAEVVYLQSAIETIDEMVNLEMITVYDDPSGASSLFRTMTHQRLFNVLLVDFLSKTDRRAPVEQSSFLGALREVAAEPHFDVGDSVAKLRTPVDQFIDWLNYAPEVRTWFPSLEREVALALPRLEFLKMTGDIAKHDLLRTVGVAKDLQRALAGSGVRVELDDAMLALDDFFQRFHTDILNYHSTYLVELLNNIRWGIHNYLIPEYRRAYKVEGGEPPRYSYRYPAGVTGKFARDRYWSLMNSVRRGPIIPRFTTAASLRNRY